ncbi:MAG: UvrD-helicase domain-containing protein [Flavobacteriales bacterium]
MGNLFTVYRSSAGSGKTETLVTEYLKLALNNPSPLYFTRILAITFTNKAAEEMRDRILTRLQLLATASDARTTELIQMLAQHCKVNETGIRQRAAEVLTQVLHNYHRFNVSTIDRFIYSVIRAFANELGVQPDAEIISDSDKVLTVSVNQLLEKAGIDETFTALLTDFMSWRQDEGAAWNPEAELVEFGKQIFEEDSRIPLQELSALSLENFMSARTQLKEKTNRFENEYKHITTAAVKISSEHGLTHDSFHQKSRGALGFFQKVLAGKHHSFEMPTVMQQFISGEACFQKSLKGAVLQQAEQAYPHLLEQATALQKLFATKYNEYVFCTEAYKRMYSLSLLASINKLRYEYLEERGAVLLADFHRIVSDVVSEEPAPFVYERTGERFNHFFIDEFQDTSQLQWGNLLPLIENGLSTGHQSLVVGDAKQSIYRWRNGKVEQFLELPALNGFEGEIWKEREESLKRNYHEEILGLNRRSAKEIIEFNNSLFEHMSVFLNGSENGSLYSRAYQGNWLHQQHTDKSISGYVQVSLVAKEEGEKKTKEENIQSVLAKLATDVESCLQDGFMEKDICVLVRTNDEGDAVSRFLTQKNYQVASGNALLLKNFAEIRLLINALRASLAPRNESDKGIFMLDYLFYTNAPDSLDVIRNYGFSRDGKRCYRLYDFMRDYNLEVSSNEIRDMTFYEVVVRFADMLKLDTRHVAVSQLLEAVQAHKAGWHFEGAEWFQWWDSVSHALTAETSGGDEAITVMTIHKAKGLQFPVVMVPFANWQIDKTKKTEWIDSRSILPEIPWVLVRNNKELWEGSSWEWIAQREDVRKRFDQMNLLYVAFTRPVNRLYVYSTEKNNSVFAWLAQAVPAVKGISAVDSSWSLGKKEKKLAGEPPKKSSGLALTQKKEHIHWTEKLRIAYTAPAELLEKNERDGARISGIRLHDILRNLDKPELNNDEVLAIMRKMSVPTEMMDLLIEKVRLVFSNKEFIALHKNSSQVFNEREWMDENGESIRPDRVIVSAGRCCIIDYKTGMEDEKHVKQMKRYMDVLKKAGYSQTEAYLFYVSDERLTRVN